MCCDSWSLQPSDNENHSRLSCPGGTSLLRPGGTSTGGERQAQGFPRARCRACPRTVEDVVSCAVDKRRTDVTSGLGGMMTTSTTDAAGRGPALPGQTLVVIGGSSGIGLETARAARADGAEVVLVGRDPGRLEHAAAEVGASRTAAFDATDSEALTRFFADLTA